MSQRIQVVRGNTLTTLRATLKDGATPLNLTGASSIVLEASAREMALTFSVTGSVFSGPAGQADFPAIGNGITAPQMAGARSLLFDAMIRLVDAASKVGSSKPFEIEMIRFPITP